MRHAMVVVSPLCGSVGSETLKKTNILSDLNVRLTQTHNVGHNLQKDVFDHSL